MLKNNQANKLYLFHKVIIFIRKIIWQNQNKMLLTFPYANRKNIYNVFSLHKFKKYIQCFFLCIWQASNSGHVTVLKTKVRVLVNADNSVNAHRIFHQINFTWLNSSHRAPWWKNTICYGGFEGLWRLVFYAIMITDNL